MKVEIKTIDNIKSLVITLPINENPQLSSTGKTYVVASSDGFTKTNEIFNGKNIAVNATAIIKK